MLTSESASAVSSTQVGLRAFEQRRLGRRQLIVLLDDMVGDAVAAYGAAAALKVESDEDARMRDRVLSDLGRACSALVRLKRLAETVLTGRAGLAQGLEPILQRLRSIADDPTAAGKRRMS